MREEARRREAVLLGRERLNPLRVGGGEEEMELRAGEVCALGVALA